MNAFAINRYGNNDVVELIDTPKPKPNPSEILVKIKAASVNPVDFKIRDGQLKLVLRPKFPLIMGNDCAGVVVEVGSEVKKFKVGDSIFSRPDKTDIGTFSEYIAIDESVAALKPKNIRFEEASTLPLVGLTCWQALIDKAAIGKGSKVFIPAGSGGVGTFAIQLAKHLGAIVATTTSTKNVGFVTELGADVVIDYKTDDFENHLSGYDVVFDTLGGDNQQKAFNVLKPGGTLISIVGPPTVQFCREFKLGPLIQLGSFFLGYKSMKLAKQKNVSYSFLLMVSNGKQLSDIAKLVEGNVIRPIVDRIFPFEQTKEALAYVEKGHARGKVVISIS